MATVTVFASSSPRVPADHLALAAGLGRLLATAGHLVVNGAGRYGGMGALNEAILAAGGAVRGVILRQFLDQGLAHPDLKELLVVDTMRVRKQLLGQSSQAFICLPGGPGTWEEFWEVAVERQTGVHCKPLVLIDHRGYYGGFIAQLGRAAADGFLYGPPDELFTTVTDAAAALAAAGLQ